MFFFFSFISLAIGLSVLLIFSKNNELSIAVFFFFYIFLSFFFFSFFFFCFLGPHPWHMKVHRVRVELDLQLPAYTTTIAVGESHPSLQPTPQLTAMPDPLNHWARPGIEPESSWMLSQISFHWAMTGTAMFFSSLFLWFLFALNLTFSSFSSFLRR